MDSGEADKLLCEDDFAADTVEKGASKGQISFGTAGAELS